MSVTIRPSTPADTATIARVVFAAFADIHDRHRFPRDFPTEAAADAFAGAWNANPRVWGVVAEADGRIVGCNFLTERNAVRGVGPIAVLPDVQGTKAGRRLMEAVVERGRDAAGIRLVQDAFNMGSMSLYASVGFEVREPLVLMTGKPSGTPPRDVEVRAMTATDLDACAELCRLVHGFDRTGELTDALGFSGPVVALRGGRVVAYLSSPWFALLNHGVAATDDDMEAVLLGAGALRPAPVGALVPGRRARLFRWCLRHGLRSVKPMTLMTLGPYQEPRGGFVPSIEY
jgi:predicted N-acetyltransferase YhbS